MKIGDEVYIHGYVDEIRKDTVIIKNEGGYFGTVMDEIEQKPKADTIDKIRAEMKELIEEHDCPMEVDGGNDMFYCIAVNGCIGIIDKYRQEG